MSWRYRTYQSKYYFSEKEIDFTAEYLDYGQFLLQEFFTADLDTRKKISNYYHNVYGARSFAYLKRKYSEWANGDYHLTVLMRDRILTIMPRFLSAQAKHKLGVHEFMASIKTTVKSFKVTQERSYRDKILLKTPQEIIPVFEKELRNIESLIIDRVRFNILTNDEKQEALEISKYILQIKLQDVFNRVERDLKIFSSNIIDYKTGNISANYTIPLFNITMNICNSVLSSVTIPKFNIADIEVNSRFKAYSDKYLAYEVFSIHKESRKAVKDSFLNENDLKLFFHHYEELSKGESEVKFSSTFQGEGGRLDLNVQLTPLKLVKHSIRISSFKLCIYFIVIVSLIILAVKNDFPATLLFGGGFLVALHSYEAIKKEIDKIKLLTKEKRRYG